MNRYCLRTGTVYGPRAALAPALCARPWRTPRGYATISSVPWAASSSEPLVLMARVSAYRAVASPRSAPTSLRLWRARRAVR